MSLLEDYTSYAELASDAPSIYHKACSYFVVSTLLGRYCHIPVSYRIRGRKLNVWLLLIGTSRITRKSTALDHAEGIIREVDEEILSAQEFTPESLYQDLGIEIDSSKPDAVKDARRIAVQQRGQVYKCWMKDEMGDFFRAINQKRYMAGVRGLLSTTYEGKGGLRRLRKETFLIPDGVYLTVGGTLPTPPHLYFSPADFQSGFLNRFLLAYTHARERTYPETYESAEAETLKKKLIEDLKEAKKSYENFSPITIHATAKVREEIDKYGLQIEREIRRLEVEHPGSLWVGYLGENPAYIHKMAALQCIASTTPTSIFIQMEMEHFEAAKKDMELFLRSAKEVVNEVESSPESRRIMTSERWLDFVYNIISSRGMEGISLTDLYKKTNLTKRELREFVITLMESKKILCSIKKSGVGRSKFNFYDANFLKEATVRGGLVSTVDLEGAW